MTDAQHSMVAALAATAREATALLAQSPLHQRNRALQAMAQALRSHSGAILLANEQDVQQAGASGAASAMLNRLQLTEGRIEAMASGLERVATLPDPLGVVSEARQVAHNGLHIEKVSIPIGVIGMIYEARPNVTADAAGLCVKSGNAVILRAGSDSLGSARAIMGALHEGLAAAGLPTAAVQLIDSADRAAVDALLAAYGLIDLVIPRGGKGLTEKVARQARVPTLLHLDGNCHTYIHAAADAAQAVAIVVNAKMRRTGICGATESLVIDRSAAPALLPQIVGRLLGQGCELRGDEEAIAIDDRIMKADESDWGTEYLDAMLSVKVVAGLDEAIAHINRYGSHHTDAIITQDDAAAERFTREIDSAIVMVNSSTQFADGGEFGMGAEIGIATGRLHARGPVGCRELTTYKYVVRSKGSVRA